MRPTELAAEPGEPVVVTGTVRDGRLVGAVEATGAGTQAVVPPGPRKTAVLLINFSSQSTPWSPAAVRSEIFTAADSASAFFAEESYGAISLTGKLNANGDVFGWFSLDVPTAGCPYNTWRDEANEAAADAGVDLSGYQHLVYKFPLQLSCLWGGVAGLGSNWAMINGDLFGIQPTVHELGHNLGLLHAGSWTCTSGGVRVQISDTCTTSEYGDPFDAMGNQAARHNSGWNLAKLGFLTADNVETVDATGTYSMQSALDPTTEPTTLRIPRTKAVNGNVTSWYYLEVRESGGVFENVSDASTSGVSIRATAAGSSAETLLLDANPATPTFQDAPLGAGQTFDGGPVQVTTVAADGGSATVSVELDEEPPTAPAGLTGTLEAGGVRLQWSASSDDFGVHRYVVFRDGGQIGITASMEFLDSEASLGEHDYVVYAEDMTGNRSAASDQVSVTVVPDEEPPTAPTGLTATAVAGGVQLQWGASSDDFGVSGYAVFRDGTRIGSASSTGFLDSFSSAGGHTYLVHARDAAGNQSTASEPASAAVPAIWGPTCAGGTCEVTFRHTGATATWVAPPGVGQAEFTVEGAQGGVDFAEGLVGRGARVVATLGSLTAAEEVTVSVGGEGEPYAEGGDGGFNGGGDGTLGGGGGGFSSVEVDSTLKLLAGGGGGDGSNGFNAVAAEEPGGGGGGRGGQAGTAGTAGVVTEVHGATLGRGNGGAAGGSGGTGGSGGQVTGTSTCPGGAFAGAAGTPGGSFAGGGGATGAGAGGGGGYVGGGQGGGAGGDECGSTAGSGGGGGGSSFAAPGLSATFTGGIRRGYGLVSIAYSNPISAGGRSYTTQPGQGLVVPVAAGVLSAAAGPSGVPLSASVVSPPAHGSLTLDDDGSFSYAPASGYVGGDSFAYRATDPAGNYASAQVALTVAMPPTASISTPAAGGTFTVGQSAPTAFSCGEGAGGTGLAACDDSSGTETVSGGAGHLDTSATGPHTYTVTATSKDGLTGSASVEYTVVPAPVPPGDPGESPDGPGAPPDDPGKPPQKVSLSLRVMSESLSELLRTRKLIVTTKVNEPAKVVLTGSAEMNVPARRRARKRSLAVFRATTVRFAGPGEKTVVLVLSRKGREMLRRATKLRLAIAGQATDAAGETTRRRVALTLDR